ncbi:MAG: hypothetical protein L0177_20530 [Chloroflexi bacterium]|nr:hypothetical protein [Chloroflexota bacterium]
MEDKPDKLDIEQIARANLDISERLFTEGVHLIYDEDGDTLFLTIGEEQPQINVHVIDGVYYGVHPETLKLVGCTIIAFASDFLANNKLFRRAFPKAIELFRANNGVIEWKGQDAQRLKPAFDFALAR